MDCPINAVRNFKAAKSTATADNVVAMRPNAPIAELHFASVDEAEVEVTVTTVNPSTHEEDIVNTASVNEVEENVVEISADEVLNRVKKIRRFQMLNTTLSCVAMTGVAAAVAKGTNRSVLGAVAVGSAWTAISTLTMRKKSISNICAEYTAKNGTDEDVKSMSSHSVGSAIGCAAGILIVGALVGRFLTRKNS